MKNTFCCGIERGTAGNMSMKNSYPLKNLQRRPGRTAALMLLSVFLTFAILGGSLLISGMKTGLSSLENKLGADIMVVPYEATTKADLNGMILQGNPGYFYMDASVTDKLKTIEGVGQVTEQFYLATVNSGCCSVKVQLIGFDPETDISIMPWIRNTYEGSIGYLDILVGNDLNAFPGDTLTFYGTECHVVGKLEQTGTYLDTAVYMTEESIKTLIQSAKDLQFNDFGDIDPESVVSCVLINVADGYSIEEVMDNINIHVRKVEAVRTQNMISEVADQLTGYTGITAVLMAAVWILALVILAVVFSMISNERKKEFAVLRVLGYTRRQLAGVIMKESLFLGAVGSILGAAAAALCGFLFSGFVETALGVPFLMPEGLSLVLLISLSVLVSIAAGTISSAICAVRIAGIDTALILHREN